MRYRTAGALASFAFALMVSVTARADLTSYRLGDGTGEDWEPAIVADGRVPLNLRRTAARISRSCAR